MARIIDNQDGTLTVMLDAVESSTFSGLPANQLSEYVTLWLDERRGQVLRERVDRLAPSDQDAIMATLMQDVQAVSMQPTKG